VLLTQLGVGASVLGSDWGYEYRPDRRSAWPLDALEHWRRTDAEHLRHWYGIREHATRHPSAQAAWQRVSELLAAGTFVAVTADAYELPHTGLGETMHFPHRIVLTAVGDDAVEVADVYRGSPLIGALPIAAVRRAMSSPGLADGPWGYDARHWTIHIEPGSGFTGDLAPDGVRERLLENATCFELEPAAGALFGVAALRGLAADLAAWSERPDPLGEGGLVHGLGILGSIASQRDLNASFVRHSSALLGEPGLAGCADELAARSSEWMTLRNLLYFRARKDPHATASRLASRVARVAAAELETSNAVGALLANHASSADRNS